MGITINMYAQYKDQEGKWHMVKTPRDIDHNPIGSKMCKNCNCDPNFYCPYWKNYVFFFKVLLNEEMKRTCFKDLEGYNHHYDEEPRDFSAITLTDIKNFNWDKETYVSKDDRGFDNREGTFKYSEISKDFIDFTIPKLEDLSNIYGGSDNIRIIFDFDC